LKPKFDCTSVLFQIGGGCPELALRPISLSPQRPKNYA
jgi:hypothetical protein